ncbi:MAG: UDP-N-acetylmuramate dehydrogenase [Alphaproteobacteria bacterium]|nr:UDP-N-acetylmuramate dehydrogenase [Alphaproteobacteria bacterium]
MALARAGLHVEVDAPLGRRVSWRVGGPADGLVLAHDTAALQAVQRVAAAHALPVLPLGAGSNLLVADAGVRGLVVPLGGALADTEVEDDVVVAGAGLRLVALLARASRAGWAGLEGLAGIPGTVGGAVRMNAGTSLGEVGDRLLWVEIVHRGGAVERLEAGALGLAYRTCHLPPGAIVARAALRTDGDAERSAVAMRDFLARRKATQPLDQPSCGSTFRNPPGDAAGRLIEAAGLKGLSVGGAQVSPKHANFLVNTGGATARDLASLVAEVQARVFAHAGVWLHPEVEVVGDWGPEGCPISLSAPRPG